MAKVCRVRSANWFGDVVDVIPCSYPNGHTRLSAQLMLRASV